MGIGFPFCQEPYIKFSKKETRGIDVDKCNEGISNGNKDRDDPEFISPLKPAIKKTSHFERRDPTYQCIKNDRVSFKPGYCLFSPLDPCCNWL